MNPASAILMLQSGTRWAKDEKSRQVWQKVKDKGLSEESEVEESV
jgi:hypothetical protein